VAELGLRGVKLARLDLSAGEVYRVEGQISLEVKKGQVLLTGGLRKEGEKIVVPRAKSVPLEAEAEASVEYTLGPDGKVEKLPGRTIPREWDALFEEMVEGKPRTVLVIGSVDVGKTFLTTYFGNRLLNHGVRMGAVDSDVGQADIGPPTTMGLGVFERPVAMLYEVPLRSAYFVGSMSPSGHMLEFVVGMKRLVERGLKLADVVMVNTPGWVSGGSGRCLQVYTEELVNPGLIIALQRQRELEHLLASFVPSKIRRLPVSTKVRPRNPKERAELRAMLLGKYFEDAKELILNMRRVRFERAYLRTGESLNPRQFGENAIYAERVPEGLILVVERGPSKKEMEILQSQFGSVRVIKKGTERNVIVGLADDAGELLGLGILWKFDYEKQQIIVTTPVTDVDSIRVVQIGSMKITRSGKEIGTIRPGTF
jgi:polynucleotide 5'-hydroxyl-kinase GRC3/NOL9